MARACPVDRAGGTLVEQPDEGFDAAALGDGLRDRGRSAREAHEVDGRKLLGSFILLRRQLLIPDDHLDERLDGPRVRNQGLVVDDGSDVEHRARRTVLSLGRASLNELDERRNPLAFGHKDLGHRVLDHCAQERLCRLRLHVDRRAREPLDKQGDTTNLGERHLMGEAISMHSVAISMHSDAISMHSDAADLLLIIDQGDAADLRERTWLA